ncbi:MAG: L-threonylcarbamoyladenylate synthase [Opitutales bacterium]|jgi:L-threonylcarbamoyladenylate synthase
MNNESPRIRRYTGTGPQMQELADALRSGNLVAIPTETVYGLAANALDPAACRRIFEVKGRPLIDPLIVHVTGVEHARRLAEVGPEAELLMERFWPGPLTLVMRKRAVVPDIVSAGLPTLALRCPRHPLTRRLLELCGLPLAAPSANRFGYVSPTRAEHVEAGLGDRIDFVLDGGPCDIGLESTIIGLADPERPVLFRPGAISREELAAALGRSVALPPARGADDVGPVDAPGMLSRHYSPRTALHIFSAGERPGIGSVGGDLVALVFFARPAPESSLWGAGAEVFWLSESGLPAEAARNVFALLRRLDEGRFSAIWMERAPAGGLGDAINDRLDRAAAGR